jgi:hypothetical protein
MEIAHGYSKIKGSAPLIALLVVRLLESCAGQRPHRARSTARQESLQSALELAGIADRYERQAIQEELARDQELAQLFASVIGKEIQAASKTQASSGGNK